MRVSMKREILQEKLDNMKGAVMMGKAMSIVGSSGPASAPHFSCVVSLPHGSA